MMSSVSCDLCKRCIHGFSVFRNIIQFSASSIACRYIYNIRMHMVLHIHTGLDKSQGA